MNTLKMALLIFTLAAGPMAFAELNGSANTLRLGDAQPGAGTIENMAWLSGYWQGPGLGGWCEEMWGNPIGDSMYGTFTMRKDNKISFSEHMTIVEEGDSLTLRVKHFSADFEAWEEKADFVSFPLVRLGNQEAYFSGLTLRRDAKDTLKIYLVLSQEGEKSEVMFDFKAVER